MFEVQEREPSPDGLVTIDARFFRLQAVEALRTFVAPFVGAARAIGDITAPRTPPAPTTKSAAAE